MELVTYYSIPESWECNEGGGNSLLKRYRKKKKRNLKGQYKFLDHNWLQIETLYFTKKNIHRSW